MRLLVIIALVLAQGGCAAPLASFKPIAGVDAATNQRISAFLDNSRVRSGRKVAVFDGDGTTFGQAPHYLADECLYLHAQAHPERKPEIIARMRPQSNVSLPYVQDRVLYLSGMTLVEVRAMGVECARRYFPDKEFAPMQALVDNLKAFGFEVWIVSASPEAMYQGFLAEAFGIPVTRIIGVKSVVDGGVLTDEMVHPVPQDRGKLRAIETFVQERPLLVGGNSRGDKEMIEYSADLKLIVNPDEFVAPDQTQSVADYARDQGWLILRIRDVPEPQCPAVSSKVFGVRTNATHDIK